MISRISNLHTVDVIVVPDCSKYLIAEPQHKQVVDDFFSQVVIDAKDLVLSPINIEGLL